MVYSPGTDPKGLDYEEAMWLLVRQLGIAQLDQVADDNPESTSLEHLREPFMSRSV